MEALTVTRPGVPATLPGRPAWYLAPRIRDILPDRFGFTVRLRFVAGSPAVDELDAVSCEVASSLSGPWLACSASRVHAPEGTNPWIYSASLPSPVRGPGWFLRLQTAGQRETWPIPYHVGNP